MIVRNFGFRVEGYYPIMQNDMEKKMEAVLGWCQFALQQSAALGWYKVLFHKIGGNQSGDKYHTIPYHIIPCHTLLYPFIPYFLLLYTVKSCSNLLYPITCHDTLLYPTIPYTTPLYPKP